MEHTASENRTEGEAWRRRRARVLELAWALALTAGIAALILGTLRSEMRKARERYAGDQLVHLAGLLTLALEDAAAAGADPSTAWDWPLLGPGEPPAGVVPGGSLAEVLPPGTWLEPDPWGRALVLALAGEGGRRFPVVACAGPDGELALEPLDPEWSEALYWPVATTNH